jgi:hypothetical protein
MSCHNLLSPKKPEAKVAITFDFSPALEVGETITSFVSRNVSTIAGLDIAPELMYVGDPIIGIDSTFVQQTVEGGLDGRYYQFEVVYDTNIGRRLVVGAVLPVLSAP